MARPLAAALVASLLAVSGAGGADLQTPKRGGTLIMGTLREPPCLNAYLERCHRNIPPAGLIMSVALRGAFEIGRGFTWEPDLVSGVQYTTAAPFTLTYRIRPEARWSDGVPITARDFVFTHDSIRRLPKADREPFAAHGHVRSVRAVDARTVRVALRARHAGWRQLFANVLPRHALQGEEFSTIWLERIHNPKTGAPIGSGPFLIANRERGLALTFVRNPRYWGTRAYLDRIVLRFCRECGDPIAEQIEWLRDGTLDLARFIGPSGAQIAQMKRIPAVRVQTAPGPIWEHVDIRLGPGGHPALTKKRVRRALAYGIDRAAITQAIYGQLGARYPPSQSAAHFSFSPYYKQNWRMYRRRPEEAMRLLEQEGCRRGGDGIYACGGERLSLRFVTESGDPIREQVAALVQRQLSGIGIEVRFVYAPWDAYVNQILLTGAGDFDLVLFSWIDMTPGRESGLADLYGCGGQQNLSGYCQRLVTSDFDQAERILDDGRRAAALNRADVQLARDVPVLPLFERPLFAASTIAVRDVSLETRAWNPFAGAETWWLDR